jgi:arylsulfatase A-like enzyme
LAKGGYDTYFSSAIVTAELPIRGRFERTDVHHDAPADEMVKQLLRWWDRTDSPRFGYVHLGDLHEPVHQPSEHPFGEIADAPNLRRWRFTRTTEPRDEFDKYRRERIRLYDTAIRFVDSQIERLFEMLTERGELDDTLIILTSDHGEEFWERVEFEREHFHDPRGIFGTGHGHALIPEVINVPLIITEGSAEEMSDRVSTIDIVPTVLSELGVSREALSSFDGVPLQRDTTDRAVLSEEIAYGYDQQAVVQDNHLLIHSPYEDEIVVLDLDSDQETVDTDIEAGLIRHLPNEKRAGERSTIDTATRDRLSDLGYL